MQSQWKKKFICSISYQRSVFPSYTSKPHNSGSEKKNTTHLSLHCTMLRVPMNFATFDQHGPIICTAASSFCWEQKHQVRELEINTSTSLNWQRCVVANKNLRIHIKSTTWHWAEWLKPMCSFGVTTITIGIVICLLTAWHLVSLVRLRQMGISIFSTCSVERGLIPVPLNYQVHFQDEPVHCLELSNSI